MLLDKFKSVIKTNEIEFLCYQEDYGIIPEPYPARKFMPEWYKSVPPIADKTSILENKTIKRCAPVLDAFKLGWIIPLVSDVEFKTNDDASNVHFKSLFHRPMIELHGVNQISTPDHPHPSLPKPPMKFMNWWIIRVPKDYSVLFVPPLNRQDPRFTCMSGFVDCDSYFEFINFPFFFNTPDYHGVVEAGTPLVQVIPIKREGLLTNQSIKSMNNKDLNDLDKTRKSRNVHRSLYFDKIWRKK